MAEPLEGREAYIAGIHDDKIAHMIARQRARGKRVSKEVLRGYVREELMKLWQAREDRGEIPSLQPQLLNRTSEAA